MSDQRRASSRSGSVTPLSDAPTLEEPLAPAEPGQLVAVPLALLQDIHRRLTQIHQDRPSRQVLRLIQRLEQTLDD